jgi:hypothetical protein
MSLNHVVIWVDSEEAHLIHFNEDPSEPDPGAHVARISHGHIKPGVTRYGSMADHTRYFREIIQAILGSIEILLIGPSEEKHELMRYIVRHHRPVAAHVVGVITADHPTDGQLISFAQRYFRKTEQMRVDQISMSRRALNF